jgi:predicted DNA-binding transcriptional regulator AlpA
MTRHREVPEHLAYINELVTLRECAERLGIPKHRMDRWVERRAKIDFPEPVEKVGKYYLFKWGDVEKWFYLWQKVTENMERKPT